MSLDAPDRPSIRYENPAPKVARIWLDRADARNAQDTKLLYELNDAFDRAAQDDDVSVIVLAAEGPHFSSGHDLRERDGLATLREHDTVGTWCGFGCAGAEAQMAREKEIYIGFSERWRNIPKPTIAAVQGKVIAGGLMLVWPCDIIVAAENAEFIDNTVAMGVCGAEFFHHPWEVGIRQAKEMLYTSDAVTAADAFRLGMVNHVVAARRAAAVRAGARRADRPEAAVRAQADEGGGQRRAGQPGTRPGARDVVRAAPAVPQPQPAGARHGHRPELPDGDRAVSRASLRRANDSARNRQ